MLIRLTSAIAGLPLASSAAFAQRPDANAPALQLGKILTLDRQSSVAEELAARDGKIVGDRGQDQGLGRAPDARERSGRQDSRSRTDRYAHSFPRPLADHVVNMSGARTVADVLAAIEQFVGVKSYFNVSPRLNTTHLKAG